MLGCVQKIVKNPKNTEHQMTIKNPQIQCLNNFVLLRLSATYTPDRNKSPAKMNDDTPKPRMIKKSLSCAPTILAIFLVSIPPSGNSDSKL